MLSEYIRGPNRTDTSNDAACLRLFFSAEIELFSTDRRFPPHNSPVCTETAQDRFQVGHKCVITSCNLSRTIKVSYCVTGEVQNTAARCRIIVKTVSIRPSYRVGPYRGNFSTVPRLWWRRITAKKVVWGCLEPKPLLLEWPQHIPLIWICANPQHPAACMMPAFGTADSSSSFIFALC